MMYVIEHALLNLGKNKGRNILLGVIIFAIIASTVVALSIFNTTGAIIDETKTALACAVRVAPHMQMVSGGGQNAAVSVETYRLFAESEYLDGADVKEGGRNVDGVDAVYYLKRPEMLSAFEEELRGKGLPDDYSVKTDEAAFESVAGSVESLRSLSATFLIIVLTLGAVIMALVSVIAVRERKYEIGVLRAMGMKKRKLALGLWVEIIAITCVCFAAAMFVGTALSQPVSDSMTAGITQTSAAQSTSLADRLNGAEEAENSYINVTMNATTALEIFAVAILLASVAGVISVSRITRYEPIKILMERN